MCSTICVIFFYMEADAINECVSVCTHMHTYKNICTDVCVSARTKMIEEEEQYLRKLGEAQVNKRGECVFIHKAFLLHGGITLKINFLICFSRNVLLYHQKLA